MRRVVVALGAALLLAGPAAATGQSRTWQSRAWQSRAWQSRAWQSSARLEASTGRSVTFKVRLIQEATYRHPHPPDGDAGDVFSTTLRLFADGTVLGFKDGTPMGTMAFSWSFTGQFACSSSAAGCKGRTDLKTLTRLPGGTLTANGDNVNLAKGMVVSVQSGSGIFKGATGTIAIAPGNAPEDVFKLILPAS